MTSRYRRRPHRPLCGHDGPRHGRARAPPSPGSRRLSPSPTSSCGRSCRGGTLMARPCRHRVGTMRQLRWAWSRLPDRLVLLPGAADDATPLFSEQITHTPYSLHPSPRPSRPPRTACTWCRPCGPHASYHDCDGFAEEAAMTPIRPVSDLRNKFAGIGACTRPGICLRLAAAWPVSCHSHKGAEEPPSSSPPRRRAACSGGFIGKPGISPPRVHARAPLGS